MLLDIHAKTAQQHEHRVDVVDLGNVVECDRVIRQQTGGQHRQSGILVADWANCSLNRVAAFNYKRGHTIIPHCWWV